MIEPAFSKEPGRYIFQWDDFDIKVMARRLHQHKAGHVTGEISIMTGLPAYPDPLHQAILNFSSTNTRAQLAKEMIRKYETLQVNWDLVLEQLCSLTLKAWREGDPIIELWPGTKYKKPSYLLEPFLFLNKPTIIFGEGGQGKSLIALLLSMTLSLPWTDNPLGLKINGLKPTNILYLDYETDRDEKLWNMARFTRGLGIGNTSIYYRRCSLPFVDDIDWIREAISEKQIGCLVIDSLGMACRGDLSTSEIALAFWGAQRELNVTTLIIAHPSKDPKLKHKTIHGSGFFSREARSVWELRQVQEPGEDESSIGLFHRKVNEGKLHKPLGFRLLFSENSIKVELQEVKRVPELAKELSLSIRIVELLKGGKMTTDDIAEKLDANAGSVRVKLYNQRVVNCNNNTTPL